MRVQVYRHLLVCRGARHAVPDSRRPGCDRLVDRQPQGVGRSGVDQRARHLVRQSVAADRDDPALADFLMDRGDPRSLIVAKHRWPDQHGDFDLNGKPHLYVLLWKCRLYQIPGPGPISSCFSLQSQLPASNYLNP